MIVFHLKVQCALKETRLVILLLLLLRQGQNVDHDSNIDFLLSFIYKKTHDVSIDHSVPWNYRILCIKSTKKSIICVYMCVFNNFKLPII